MKRIHRFEILAAAAASVAALLWSSTAHATLPYVPVPFGPIVLGPGLAPPSVTFGKEYSHDRDHEITAVGVAPDPQQIVAWDGSGGVANGLDFSFTRPNFTPDFDIDAIANHGDALYVELKDEKAHLLYSISARGAMVPARGMPAPLPPPIMPVPSAGPIPLVNGNVIGGAGEISYELGVGFGALPATHGVWAVQADINGMPLPIDIDGLEVWGPEPGFTADTDKYSLVSDAISGVSIWNDTGSAYIPYGTILGAVTSLLGPLPTNIPNIEQLIDLDALMVRDVFSTSEGFDRNPTGGPGGDEIIFSIRQVPNPFDPSGFYATGSELFVLNAAAPPSFLFHGGHLWDKAWALANMVAILVDPASGQEVLVQLDINAIEAGADTVVPEPTSAMLLAVSLGVVAGARRRSRRA
ncbi:MAG TPA: PEP-CTERM sorting domain-containing protein [Lacipirellulaceae bacterium]|nr:PEP-CTERM sorting domain-containing protein [Lacipirellulaceae bacterium]